MSELPPLTKQQVCDALWNKSQTKQLYTIPKAIRFHSIKPLSNTDFYDLPSVRNERAAGIGYGMRSELVSTRRTQTNLHSIQLNVISMKGMKKDLIILFLIQEMLIRKSMWRRIF